MPADAPTFVLFDRAHLASLAIIAVVAFAFPWLMRRLAPLRWQVRIGVLLGLLLLLLEPLSMWLRVQVYGDALALILPLHLCGLAMLLTAATLVLRSHRAYEVVYFWAWGGTLQALLTPDLRLGFPDLRYISFFIGHGLILVGVLYATLVYGFRPYAVSILRSMAALALTALLIAPINYWLGANYLYLSRKPEQASLMDLLGPWPWYILSLSLLAVLSSGLFYLPFWIRDHLGRRSLARPGSA